MGKMVKAEGDLIVMTNGDTGQSRLARANHIDARAV